MYKDKILTIILFSLESILMSLSLVVLATAGNCTILDFYTYYVLILEKENVKHLLLLKIVQYWFLDVLHTFWNGKYSNLDFYTYFAAMQLLRVQNCYNANVN